MKTLKFIAIVFIASGCGVFEPMEYPEQEPPVVEVIIDDPDGEDPDAPGQGTTYDEIQTIIERKCISCHSGDGFTKTERQLRDSGAFNRVQRSEMPPGNPLQGAERSKFLNFFSTTIASHSVIDCVPGDRFARNCLSPGLDDEPFIRAFGP